ncbi:MAG: hypothetical protein AAGB31_05620 [Bdellovibrio sp.]
MKYLMLVLLFFTGTVQAQSLSESSRSVRARGMGGVLIPFVNNAEAVFYNPAALGKTAALDITLMNLIGGANEFTIDSLSEIQDIDVNDSSTFNQFFGKRIWAQASAKAAISIANLSFGYLNDAEVSTVLHNPAFPQFETYFRNDSAVYLGGAVALGPQSYLGMSVKRVNRWGGATQELGLSTISDANNIEDIGDSFDNRGQGYGLDVAVMTELPSPFKPTFAVVWEDVGSTAFTKTDGLEAPPRIEQNLSFGAGISMDLPGLDWQLGMETRHLLQSDIEIGKKLYFGTEVSLPMIDLRAGYSQGYLTYGAGVNFLILHLDAVSYAEETGVYPGQSGDRRYMVSLSIDLSFDANFNFTDNTGKKRKLKQRR